MRPGTADLLFFRVSPSWGGARFLQFRDRTEEGASRWLQAGLVPAGPDLVWDGRVSKNLLIPAMKRAEVFRGALYQVSCWDLERAEGEARWGRVGKWTKGGIYEHRVVFRQSGRFLGGWAAAGAE